jgi:hypothetical protein
MAVELWRVVDLDIPNFTLSVPEDTPHRRHGAGFHISELVSSLFKPKIRLEDIRV